MKSLKKIFTVVVFWVLLILGVNECRAQKTFALLDTGKVVLNVVVVDNEYAPNEAAAVSYLRTVFGQSTVWVQCYYQKDTSARKNFPQVGVTYDLVNDCFVYPKPTEGTYTLNPATCKWDTAGVAPTGGGPE